MLRQMTFSHIPCQCFGMGGRSGVEMFAGSHEQAARRGGYTGPSRRLLAALTFRLCSAGSPGFRVSVRELWCVTRAINRHFPFWQPQHIPLALHMSTALSSINNHVQTLPGPTWPHSLLCPAHRAGLDSARGS